MQLDAETAVIVESYRRRRALGEALLAELDAALEARQPKRVVSAPGWREVGVARFRNVRLASAKATNRM